MKKIFIIFSLGMMLVAGLFGGQIVNVDSGMMLGHEMEMGCESGICEGPLATSCAEHCFAAAVQDQVLPMISTPLFVYVMILSAIIALVVLDLKQSFYSQQFTIPLNKRLALNAVRRE